MARNFSFGDPPCAPARRGAERRGGLRTDLPARCSGAGAAGAPRPHPDRAARKTGIDQGDISRIERGSIFSNEKTLLRLADALGAEWRMVDKATA